MALELWAVAKFILALIVVIILVVLFLIGLFCTIGLPIGMVAEADSKVLGVLGALIYAVVIGGLIDWGISTHGLRDTLETGSGILVLVGLLGYVAIEDGGT